MIPERTAFWFHVGLVGVGLAHMWAGARLKSMLGEAEIIGGGLMAAFHVVCAKRHWNRL